MIKPKAAESRQVIKLPGNSRRINGDNYTEVFSARPGYVMRKPYAKVIIDDSNEVVNPLMSEEIFMTILPL